MKNSREQWGSRLGFILAASGSAVGLGTTYSGLDFRGVINVSVFNPDSYTDSLIYSTVSSLVNLN